MLDIRKIYDNCKSDQYSMLLIYYNVVYEYDNINSNQVKYIFKNTMYNCYMEDGKLIFEGYGGENIEITSDMKILGIENSFYDTQITNILFFNSKIYNISNYMNNNGLGAIRVSYIDEEHGKKFIFLSELDHIRFGCHNNHISMSFTSNDIRVIITESLPKGNLSIVIVTTKDEDWYINKQYIKYKDICLSPCQRYND